MVQHLFGLIPKQTFVDLVYAAAQSQVPNRKNQEDFQAMSDHRTPKDHKKTRVEHDHAHQ